eukprot:scaffold8462_cov110-Isochrysis_galbana.AAC.2
MSKEIVPMVASAWASCKPSAAAPVMLISHRCKTSPSSPARDAPSATCAAAASPIGLPARLRYCNDVLTSISLLSTTAASGLIPLCARSMVSSFSRPVSAETGSRELHTVVLSSSASHPRSTSVCSATFGVATMPSASASAPGTLSRDASSSRELRGAPA